MNSNPPGPLIQLVEAIGALLRSSRPRVGDLRTLVEQTRARCHAEDRSLSGLLNTHILIAGSPTSLLALAASVQDAGSALACIRLLLAYEADPGIMPSCENCRGSAYLAVALRRRPGFVPTLSPGHITFPLHAAAERGNAGVIEALVVAGACPHVYDAWDETPLDIAESRGMQASTHDIDKFDSAARFLRRACAGKHAGATQVPLDDSAVDAASRRGRGRAPSLTHRDEGPVAVLSTTGTTASAYPASHGSSQPSTAVFTSSASGAAVASAADNPDDYRDTMPSRLEDREQLHMTAHGTTARGAHATVNAALCSTNGAPPMPVTRTAELAAGHEMPHPTPDTDRPDSRLSIHNTTSRPPTSQAISHAAAVSPPLVNVGSAAAGSGFARVTALSTSRLSTSSGCSADSQIADEKRSGGYGGGSERLPGRTTLLLAEWEAAAEAARLQMEMRSATAAAMRQRDSVPSATCDSAVAAVENVVGHSNNLVTSKTVTNNTADDVAIPQGSGRGAAAGGVPSSSTSAVHSCSTTTTTKPVRADIYHSNRSVAQAHGRRSSFADDHDLLHESLGKTASTSSDGSTSAAADDTADQRVHTYSHAHAHAGDEFPSRGDQAVATTTTSACGGANALDVPLHDEAPPQSAPSRLVCRNASNDDDDLSPVASSWLAGGVKPLMWVPACATGPPRGAARDSDVGAEVCSAKETRDGHTFYVSAGYDAQFNRDHDDLTGAPPSPQLLVPSPIVGGTTRGAERSSCELLLSPSPVHGTGSSGAATLPERMHTPRNSSPGSAAPTAETHASPRAPEFACSAATAGDHDVTVACDRSHAHAHAHGRSERGDSIVTNASSHQCEHPSRHLRLRLSGTAVDAATSSGVVAEHSNSTNTPAQYRPSSVSTRSTYAYSVGTGGSHAHAVTDASTRTYAAYSMSDRAPSASIANSKLERNALSIDVDRGRDEAGSTSTRSGFMSPLSAMSTRVSSMFFRQLMHPQAVTGVERTPTGQQQQHRRIAASEEGAGGETVRPHAQAHERAHAHALSATTGSRAPTGAWGDTVEASSTTLGHAAAAPPPPPPLLAPSDTTRTTTEWLAEATPLSQDAYMEALRGAREKVKARTLLQRPPKIKARHIECSPGGISDTTDIDSPNVSAWSTGTTHGSWTNGSTVAEAAAAAAVQPVSSKSVGLARTGSTSAPHTSPALPVDVMRVRRSQTERGTRSKFAPLDSTAARTPSSTAGAAEGSTAGRDPRRRSGQSTGMFRFPSTPSYQEPATPTFSGGNSVRHLTAANASQLSKLSHSQALSGLRRAMPLSTSFPLAVLRSPVALRKWVASMAKALPSPVLGAMLVAPGAADEVAKSFSGRMARSTSVATERTPTTKTPLVRSTSTASNFGAAHASDRGQDSAFASGSSNSFKSSSSTSSGSGSGSTPPPTPQSHPAAGATPVGEASTPTRHRSYIYNDSDQTSGIPARGSCTTPSAPVDSGTGGGVDRTSMRSSAMARPLSSSSVMRMQSSISSSPSESSPTGRSTHNGDAGAMQSAVLTQQIHDAGLSTVQGRVVTTRRNSDGSVMPIDTRMKQRGSADGGSLTVYASSIMAGEQQYSGSTLLLPASSRDYSGEFTYPGGGATGDSVDHAHQRDLSKLYHEHYSSGGGAASRPAAAAAEVKSVSAVRNCCWGWCS